MCIEKIEIVKNRDRQRNSDRSYEILVPAEKESLEKALTTQIEVSRKKKNFAIIGFVWALE